LKHQCKITWQVKAQIAHVSFGVKSCLIHCKASNADYRHTHVFGRAFNVSEEDGSCVCHKGKIKIGSLGGKCSDDSAKECFLLYAKAATKTFETDNKSAWTQSNPDLYRDKNFFYSCEKNACPKGCNFGVNLPSIAELKTHREKDAINLIREKFEKGEKLDSAEQEIFDEVDAGEKAGETQATDLFDVEEIRERKKKNVVFVVDISGSMSLYIRSGSSWTRMYVMVKELKRIIGNFTVDVNFNLIAFNHEHKAFSSELVEGNDANKEDAVDWITSLKPNGQTRFDEPLKSALSMPGVDVVYFLSDGMANQGCTQIGCLIPTSNEIPVHTTFYAPEGSGWAFIDWLSGFSAATTLLQAISTETGGKFRMPF